MKGRRGNPKKKQASFKRLEHPSFTYKDVLDGFGLDPRKQLGKALSGLMIEEKRRVGFNIQETKYVCDSRLLLLILVREVYSPKEIAKRLAVADEKSKKDAAKAEAASRKRAAAAQKATDKAKKDADKAAKAQAKLTKVAAKVASKHMQVPVKVREAIVQILCVMSYTLIVCDKQETCTGNGECVACTTETLSCCTCAVALQLNEPTCNYLRVVVGVVDRLRRARVRAHEQILACQDATIVL